MNRKLIIDGNAIYEIDEDCMLKNRVNVDKDKKEEEHAENRDDSGSRK